MGTNQGKSKALELSAQEVERIRLFKSFSNRWGSMYPIFDYYKGSQCNKDQLARVQSRLAKVYSRSASMLLGFLEEKARSKLHAEVTATDFTLLVKHLQQPRPSRDELCEELRSTLAPPVAPTEPLPAPSEANVGDVQEEAVQPEAGVRPKVVEAPSLTDDDLESLGAALLLTGMENFRPYHDGNTLAGPKLFERLKSLQPSVDDASMRRLIVLFKRKAGRLYVEFDDGNDIPF